MAVWNISFEVFVAVEVLISNEAMAKLGLCSVKEDRYLSD